MEISTGFELPSKRELRRFWLAAFRLTLGESD